MWQHENGVTITFLHRSPGVDGYLWEAFYRVTDTKTKLNFVVSTAHGRTCAFNMMSGVSSYLWATQNTKPVWQRLQAALHSYFFLREGPDDGKALFRIGQLFWCQNTNCKRDVVPWLVPQFDWQGSSEPDHKTTMFMFDFTQPIE